jgi:NADH dehydrogenase
MATIDQKPMVKFSFKALGILASLGQRSAVAEIFGVKLTGFFAWFMWRTIYLSKLPGFARKLRVALDWTLDLFFPRDITQLQVFQEQRLDIHHYERGEHIVRKGQIGREFYIILKGDVEVLGSGDAVLATLREREVFGEKALLEDTPRTATVRAATPVDVLVMSRGDFRSVVGSFPVLDDYFTKLLHERHPEAIAMMPERWTHEPIVPNDVSLAASDVGRA